MIKITRYDNDKFDRDWEFMHIQQVEKILILSNKSFLLSGYDKDSKPLCCCLMPESSHLSYKLRFGNDEIEMSHDLTAVSIQLNNIFVYQTLEDI